MMQFYKRFDQCQTDAGTAGSPLSLEETFENLSRFILRNSLAGIPDIKTQSFRFILQRNKDITAHRSIFQGIAQEIEYHSGYLLLISNHLMTT